MYHPPNDLESLQYLELFNRGSSEVSLGNWSFTKGVKFTFPKDAKIGPGGFVVVCRSTNDFFGRYGREIPALGNFTGKLSHRGDHIELVNAQKQSDRLRDLFGSRRLAHGAGRSLRFLGAHLPWRCRRTARQLDGLEIVRRPTAGRNTRTTE